MSRVDFKLEDVELQTNLQHFGATINKQITLTTDFGADRGQRTMKMEAPWHDRTGNARAGLHTKPEHLGAGPIGFIIHRIVFAHGVDYGIWLEIANSGKYQIIMPVVVQTGHEIMKALKDMFNHLGVPPELEVEVNIPRPHRKGTSQGATVKAGKEVRAAKRGTKRTTKTIPTLRTRRS